MTQKTYGHGDPVLDASLVRLHDQATREGRAMYHDPNLELWVQTSETLAKNGKCCGRCCRHCPYDRSQQEAANRAIPPPPVIHARSVSPLRS